jgi:hypothetical protein
VTPPKPPLTWHWWLTPVILATQEAEIRRIEFGRPYLENTHHTKGLVEWLKVQALSSSLSIAK